MFEELSPSQQRYLTCIFPHKEKIKDLLDQKIFSNGSKTTYRDIAFMLAPEIKMDPSLFLSGFALLVSEGILQGIRSAKRAGTSKSGPLSIAPYALGKAPEPRNKSRFFPTKNVQDTIEQLPIIQPESIMADKKPSPLSVYKKAIREKCLDCNSTRENVIKCEVKNCALYHLRPFQGSMEESE